MIHDIEKLNRQLVLVNGIGLTVCGLVGAVLSAMAAWQCLQKLSLLFSPW